MYIHYDEPKGERCTNGSICNDIDSVLLARQELKLAILQTIEAGDEGMQYGLYHPFSAVSQDARERFAEAVIQRLRS